MYSASTRSVFEGPIRGSGLLHCLVIVYIDTILLTTDRSCIVLPCMVYNFFCMDHFVDEVQSRAVLASTIYLQDPFIYGLFVNGPSDEQVLSRAVYSWMVI